MIRPILKTSFLFVLLIFLSIQGSISLETENEGQIQQVMNNQAISKSLKMSPDYGKIPLYFITNEGQVYEKAFFYAKASRYTLWLTNEGLVFDSARRIKKESIKSMRPNPRDVNNPEDFKYDRDVSRLVFINANRTPEVIPVHDTEHKVNYFIGNDKSKWRTNIQTSKAVLYKELYPNIDLKVYGVENQIEYDFIVKPGGEVSDISLAYKNVENTEIDIGGNLVIETKAGEIEHTKPVCYQVIEGNKVEIEARLRKVATDAYSFEVREYNRAFELIIDPLVSIYYSTYLGGGREDYGHDIAVDSVGAVYIIGETMSANFPTQNPIQESYAGNDDVFITKINDSGDALVYSTYLGGGADDYGNGIAVDLEGSAYVTGETWSTNFPTHP